MALTVIIAGTHDQHNFTLPMFLSRSNTDGDNYPEDLSLIAIMGSNK